MMAETEKQHLVAKPVQSISLPEAGIKIREPVSEKIDLTVFQKKNQKKDEKLSSILKKINIPETTKLITELEDMSMVDVSMVQTNSNIETKTESAEKQNDSITEDHQSGFKSFMRKWFKITW